jgi:hypothetical protein
MQIVYCLQIIFSQPEKPLQHWQSYDNSIDNSDKLGHQIESVVEARSIDREPPDAKPAVLRFSSAIAPV